MGEEQSLQRLRDELSSTYAALAAKLAPSPSEEAQLSDNERQMAVLRRSLQELEAENAALRVEVEMLEAAGATGVLQITDDGHDETVSVSTAAAPAALSRKPTYAR